MFLKVARHFIAFVILLHCVGATQLVSSFAFDKSIFLGMLSMAEEETKKEADTKEDADDFKHHSRYTLLSPSLISQYSRLYVCFSKIRITNQFVTDNPTPPPDYTS